MRSYCRKFPLGVAMSDGGRLCRVLTQMSDYETSPENDDEGKDDDAIDRGEYTTGYVMINLCTSFPFLRGRVD